MKRFAYVLALLAFGAAIVVSGISPTPQRAEVLAQALPAAAPP